MFGVLDWPINSSRGLSAIAEFLVLVLRLFFSITLSEYHRHSPKTTTELPFLQQHGEIFCPSSCDPRCHESVPRRTLHTSRLFLLVISGGGGAAASVGDNKSHTYAATGRPTAPVWHSRSQAASELAAERTAAAPKRRRQTISELAAVSQTSVWQNVASITAPIHNYHTTVLLSTAHQLARAIVYSAILFYRFCSVRPSICDVLLLCVNECTFRQTFFFYILVVFLAPPPYKIPRGTPWC